MSDDAIQRYEQELAEDPRSRAFAPLAEAYRKAGRLDDAINAARTGLEVHPGYSAGLVVLGRALYDKGELDNAAETLQIAVSETPENYLGQKFLGKVLMAKGENQGALRALEAANFLSPEDEEVARLLEEVRSKAVAPEAIKYEAKTSESEAQIVTYEQKPTTVDGIELPPLPAGADEDTFSFSGGGTIDPADITPVPVEEDVSEDMEVNDILVDEMDVEEMTATVIEDEEVEQAMEIESLDELGPEAAAFIQEGETIAIESMDGIPDEIEAVDQVPDEFSIETEDVPSAPADFAVEPVAPEVPEPLPAAGSVSPAASPTTGGSERSQAESAVGVSAPAVEPVFTPPAEAAPQQLPEPVPAAASEAAPASPVVPSSSEEQEPEAFISVPVMEEVSAPEPMVEMETPPPPDPDPFPVAFEPPLDPAAAEAGMDKGTSAVIREAVAVETEDKHVHAPGPEMAPVVHTPLETLPADAGGGEEQFSTETLADLYAQQGLIEKAVGIYRQILEQAPDNEGVKIKLDALGGQELSGAGSMEGAAPPAQPHVEPSQEDQKDDTLSILEGLLENVERIKQP